MTIKPCKQCLYRAGLYTLAAAAALLLLAALTEHAVRTVDHYTHPAPGRLIDVGGYRLHLDCRGEGSPTVVLEAGASQGTVSWALVQARLAHETRVCSYDRAAMGWSDAPTTTPTPEQTVHDLHTLLDRAGVHGPLLLVGHSIGGVYARLYTARYPRQVQGLVLIDPVHEDGLRQLWQTHPPLAARMQANEEGVHTLLQWLDLASALGVPRLLFREGLAVYPPELRPAYAATYFRPARLRASLEEIVQLHPKLDAVRPLLTDLGTRPLRVITASLTLPVPGLNAEESRLVYENHRQMQRRLLTLSRNSEQVIAATGHNVQLEDPALVLGVISELLTHLSHTPPGI